MLCKPLILSQFVILQIDFNMQKDEKLTIVLLALLFAEMLVLRLCKPRI